MQWRSRWTRSALCDHVAGKERRGAVVAERGRTRHLSADGSRRGRPTASLSQIIRVRRRRWPVPEADRGAALERRQLCRRACGASFGASFRRAHTVLVGVSHTPPVCSRREERREQRRLRLGCRRLPAPLMTWPTAGEPRWLSVPCPRHSANGPERRVLPCLLLYGYVRGEDRGGCGWAAEPLPRALATTQAPQRQRLSQRESL